MQLIYTSIAVRDMTDSDLDDILMTSLSRNADLHITGLLVHFAKTREFIQLLEGAPADVFGLYNGAIVEDPRHRSLDIFYTRDTDARLCPDWRMSFCLERYGTLKDRLGLSDFVQGGAFPGSRAALAYRLMVAYRDDILRKAGTTC